MIEVEPVAAAKLFGDRIELARQYTADLAEHGEILGLIGPQELARLWSRHVVNCGLLAPLIRRGGTVADVGSGAGLPGLVLALAVPETSFTLIEPMERRVAWLSEESERLGLENVTVLRARAEETGIAVDQVTARAVSALRTLVPNCRGLLSVGGEMLFLKGASVEDEIAAARKQLLKAGLRDPEVLVLGEEIGAEPTRVFRATVV
ncbi:16S rRNA (guanine(527)-N(7))-methyltransferase RsmG [Arenivirga flava]|uniref:Ribosomal RNA small subunit methyltransferase G n=1 Tax=Arenivirga flava TaxID=1930060 RepID=A0AA37UMM9_9MICO|nr:16S rRNA (guanine(527)-N(7))-methyltransferase RsmG [Arenivirga flava]GMA29030.1 ribosomal RNA small subunit methyltransferase G [Arenivirga flava]